MEYPILPEEVEQWDLGDLIDKCRELRIYDRNSMKSEDDFRQALRKYINDNLDDVDPSFNDVLLRTVKHLSKEYRRKQEKLKMFYDNMIETLSDDSMDSFLRSKLESSNSDMAQQAQRRKAQLDRDIQPIVVAGEVSAGKSSFINNLIGEDLLPTKLQHTTAVICRIRNSTQRVVELTTKNGDVLEEIECEDDIDIKQTVQKYADNKFTKKNKKHDYVDIYWPLPFLQDTLEIVDTPGIDESKEFEEVVTDYIKKAIVVVYIIDAANAGGLRERGTKKIQEIADALLVPTEPSLRGGDAETMLFVLNKWDRVGEEEKDDIYNENVEKLSGSWPGFSKTQMVLIDSRKDKAVRRSKVTGQLVYSRSFRELLGTVSSLIEKTFIWFINSHERWIENALLSLGATMDALYRRCNKTNKEKEMILKRQRGEINRLKLYLKEAKGEIQHLIAEVCEKQYGEVNTAMASEVFRRQNFKFSEWELPPWYNYFNSNSKVTSLVWSKIPVVIEHKILRRDEQKTMENFQKEMRRKGEEIARHFSRAFHTREEIGRTERMSSSSSAILTLDEGIGLCGVGMGGSLFMMGVFSRLSLSLLTGLSALSFLGLGAIAGISSLYHGVKEFQYHRDRDGYITRLAYEMFKEHYLKTTESGVVLMSCIRKIYSEIEEEISRILDHEIPNAIEMNRDFLTVVEQDLVKPEAMKRRLEPVQQNHDGMLQSILKFTAGNSSLLSENDEQEPMENYMSENGGYALYTSNCLRGVVQQGTDTTYRKGSLPEEQASRRLLLQPLYDKNVKDALKWILISDKIRSENTTNQHILPLKGLVVTDSIFRFTLLTNAIRENLSNYVARNLDRRGLLSVDVLADLSSGVLDGLSFLHDRKLVHGCLTGANVKISEGGVVKLMFTGYDICYSGIVSEEIKERSTRRCRRYSQTDRARPMGFGSASRFDDFPRLPTHLAPEFLLGTTEKYTAEADVYSFGVLLWEIRNNRRAFIEKTPLRSPVSLQTLLDYVDDGGCPSVDDHSYPGHLAFQEYDPVDNLVRKCLKRLPKNRPAITKIKDDLNMLREG